MKPQSSCSYKNNNCGITILGITTFSCGIILLFLKSWFLELLTTSLLVLKPNSLLEEVWRKIPDIPTDIYLFNWTNSEDFHNFTIRPKFEQVGPYRFMQDIEKVNVVWNDNNTVTYNQARHWHFDEEHTNEHLSKQVTTINTLTLKKNMQPSFFAAFIRKTNRAAFLGAFAISLGITFLLMENLFMEFIIASMLVLKPNSAIVDAWSKMPISLPTNVYFFNWTNPEDFHDISIKPQFEQVGPYRFMQNMEKVNVIWNDNNTVTYNQMRYWHFDEKYKNGNLSDKITTINAVTLGAAHYIRNWNYVLKRGTSLFIQTVAPQLNISRTVNQLLFDGYDDLLVDLARYLPFIASEVPRFDRFGWFRIINGSKTFEGVYNMANGVDGNFEVRNWNYNSVTPYFEGSCAKVHGSGGELYSSKPSKDHIGIFLSHLCRYLKFDFEEEVIVDGVLGYKYSIGRGVLDNGTLVPGNECYCAGDCIPSGMINVSSCRYGSPTYASLPNFYSADPVYLDAVKGLQPDKAQHEAYIVLEPKTALPLKAVVRLQLNILVNPVKDVSLYEDVRRIFFPLLWVEQKATLPDNAMLMLKIVLNFPYVVITLAIILIVLGLYLLVFVAFKPIFISIYRKMYEDKQCILLKPEEVPLQSDIKNSAVKLVLQNKDCT